MFLDHEPTVDVISRHWKTVRLAGLMRGPLDEAGVEALRTAYQEVVDPAVHSRTAVVDRVFRLVPDPDGATPVTVPGVAARARLSRRAPPTRDAR